MQPKTEKNVLWVVFAPDLKTFTVVKSVHNVYDLPVIKLDYGGNDAHCIEQATADAVSKGVPCKNWTVAGVLRYGSNFLGALDEYAVCVGIADLSRVEQAGKLILISDSDIPDGPYWLTWLIPFCRARVDIADKNTLLSATFILE